MSRSFCFIVLLHEVWGKAKCQQEKERFQFIQLLPGDSTLPMEMVLVWDRHLSSPSHI